MDKKAKIVQAGEYVAGWLDSSIPDFLELLPRDSVSTAYALITCLDSNPEPKSLLKRNGELVSAMNGVKPLKKGLLVPAKLLHKASLRKQLFFGFDEIWFFPSDKITEKPKSAGIVGPNRIDQLQLDKLEPWLVENNCSLALGDGDGLNLIVKAKGLVKYVIAHSLSQPEPTFHMDELWVQDEEKEPAKGKSPKCRSMNNA